MFACELRKLAVGKEHLLIQVQTLRHTTQAQNFKIRGPSIVILGTHMLV